jgi:hypothetical protein
MENNETYGKVELGTNFEMPNCKDHQSFTRSIKSLKNNISAAPDASIDYKMPQIPILESNEKLNTFAYFGWSTTDEMTTSSDIYSTSTFNCKSRTSNLSSSLQDTYVTSSSKGTLEPLFFIQAPKFFFF